MHTCFIFILTSAPQLLCKRVSNRSRQACFSRSRCHKSCERARRDLNARPPAPQAGALMSVDADCIRVMRNFQLSYGPLQRRIQICVNLLIKSTPAIKITYFSRMTVFEQFPTISPFCQASITISYSPGETPAQP